MIERRVELAEDGSTYGDKVALLFEDNASGNKLTFYCDPDGLYVLLHDAIAKMANMGIDTSDPAQVKRKRLAALVKVAIKGMLMLYGDQILDELFATKDHPRPGKGMDLLDWYTDMFTRVGIGYLMRQDTVLLGALSHEESNERVYTVGEVFTRPVPAPAIPATSGV